MRTKTNIFELSNRKQYRFVLRKGNVLHLGNVIFTVTAQFIYLHSRVTMNPVWNALITTVHASEYQCVLAITGGGSTAIGQLLEVPGASRTVLEAVVPYASTALADWLGASYMSDAAEQSCSEPTARAMAMAAWMRARELAPDADPYKLIGVGATASLVSDRPKRGEHRVHVATQTAEETVVFSLVLAKGKRDRHAEEAVVAKLLLLRLAEACSLGDNSQAVTSLDLALLAGEEIIIARQRAEAEWTDLLLGKRKLVVSREATDTRAIFPGAFNPPHVGHEQIATIAAKRLGCPVAYELSITNVDKPPLDFVEIAVRLGELQRNHVSHTVLLTDAPTFRAKAALFPGCTFVVGVDTVVRIADARYYSGPGNLEAALQQIADHGCRFLAFGREIEGEFCVLSDLDLPPALRKLCDEVPVEEFRADVSSTELRNEARPD